MALSLSGLIDEAHAKVGSMAALEDLAAEEFAEDVTLHEAMQSWTISMARDYFGSGGDLNHDMLVSGGADFPSTTAKLAALPALGKSSASFAPFDDPAVTILKPEARVRLFVFYGIAEQARIMNEMVPAAPAWLEIRIVEMQGHGARKNEAFTPCSQKSEKLDPGVLTPEHFGYYAKLVDELSPYLDCAYAIFGFSHGTLPTYSSIMELQRRGRAIRQPLMCFLSGRGPIHCPPMAGHKADPGGKKASLEAIATYNEEDMCALMHALRWLPPSQTLDARAAALYRYACILVAPLVTNEMLGGPIKRLDGGDGECVHYALWDHKDVRAVGFGRPDKLEKFQCPVTLLPSNADEVWHWSLQVEWKALAAGKCTKTVIDGVPHHKLACDTTQLLPELFATLAGSALATI
jgi:surfactin synthase thioesterase subunit